MTAAPPDNSAAIAREVVAVSGCNAQSFSSPSLLCARPVGHRESYHSHPGRGEGPILWSHSGPTSVPMDYIVQQNAKGWPDLDAQIAAARLQPVGTHVEIAPGVYVAGEAVEGGGHAD